jgi:endonuclease YncB( thermonuclease family)
MASDQRWRWAGIVSVISVGGVLVTDIVANVVGGYISEQIKSWQVPDEAPLGAQHAPPPASATDTVSSIPPPSSEGQLTMAAIAPKPASAPLPEIDIGEPAPEPEAYSEVARVPDPMPLPPPDPQPMPLSGTVDQVIDTATLKIQGETIELAGVSGLGSPYSDQLAKFIEEQGSQIRCEPVDERYVCFVRNVDLGLAALTNGAARPAADATPQYRQASDEARRNRRGIFQ